MGVRDASFFDLTMGSSKFFTAFNTNELVAGLAFKANKLVLALICRLNTLEVPVGFFLSHPITGKEGIQRHGNFDWSGIHALYLQKIRITISYSNGLLLKSQVVVK